MNNNIYKSTLNENFYLTIINNEKINLIKENKESNNNFEITNSNKY